jgi:glycosyltransferase involved in cell wall biosynthesis
MIYVCIPSHNEAETIGLLLWKIRKVFEEFPREYQILVGDDGSTDRTPELLEPYTRVLPLTVIRSEARRGYSRTVETLLVRALELTDRPKRDSVVLMHGDFTHGPHYLPEFVKRLDSGADLVVGEASTLTGEASRARRLARRWASRFLRRGVRVKGVSDLVCGFVAVRLVVLRHVLKSAGRTLHMEGWSANAELIGKAARQSRRVESVRIEERYDLRSRASRVRPWEALREAWRGGSRIKLPAPERPSSGAAA